MKEKILNFLFNKTPNFAIKYLTKNNLQEYNENIDEQLKISNILIYFYSCIMLFFIENIPNDFYYSSFFIISIFFILFYLFLSNKIVELIKNKDNFKKLILLLELTTNAINPIFVPIATITSSISALKFLLLPIAITFLFIIILMLIYYELLLKYFYNK